MLCRARWALLSCSSLDALMLDACKVQELRTRLAEGVEKLKVAQPVHPSIFVST